jgi:polygalacturonase
MAKANCIGTASARMAARVRHFVFPSARLSLNTSIVKPKFFYAHNMINSTISGITILNSPVQVFSVNGATNLTISDVTINNLAGNALGGHNTDGFDIGSSDSIMIKNSKILNQVRCALAYKTTFY